MTLSFLEILNWYLYECSKKLTNTDTFFSWIPVRRSVTGILKFVAHFWFESVLQCSNFLHWCATMFEFSALLYVYRHANLCSGLRAILSPQLIKKEFAILSIAPRKRHQRDSNPNLSDRRSTLYRWATEPIDEELTFVRLYIPNI